MLDGGDDAAVRGEQVPVKAATDFFMTNFPGMCVPFVVRIPGEVPADELLDTRVVGVATLLVRLGGTGLAQYR